MTTTTTNRRRSRGVASVPAPAPAPAPTVPADLPGWAWEPHPNGTHEWRLLSPDRTWHTRWRLIYVRAEAEARRWVLSQPGRGVAPVAAPAGIGEAPMGWIAICSSCDQSFIADHLINDSEPQICAACACAATAWQPGPDTSGVFRRPPGMAERVMADPHQLIDGRWQPRKAMDETKMAELTASVTENGVIEDLIALVNENGLLELIAGHRRKLAAIRAGIAQVPVKVVEKTAAQARALAIISNDDREDLNDVERGQAYEQIIADEGISEAELARRLGRPRSYIQQRRQVASAALEIAEALAKGGISFTQARGICVGASCDVEAQRHALDKVQTDTKVYGRTTSEADARGYAEKHVRERTETALKALGWQIASFYGNKMHTFVYGGAERPTEWTPAQMIQAVEQQRRPAEGAPPTKRKITSAEDTAIKRRGWEVSTTTFIGWILAKVGGKPKVLHPDELPGMIQAARIDLLALKDRFKAHGWKLTWNDTGTMWQATSDQGREERDYSYTKAEQLIKQIAASKVDAAPPPAKEHCAACGADLRDCDDWTWHNQQKLCKSCHAVALSAEADERAQLRVELPIEWLTPVPDDILYYLTQAHQFTDRVLFGRRESDEKIALALDKLSREQSEETLLSAIAWSKWAFRQAVPELDEGQEPQQRTPIDYEQDDEEEIAVGEEVSEQ